MTKRELSGLEKVIVTQMKINEDIFKQLDNLKRQNRRLEASVQSLEWLLIGFMSMGIVLALAVKF